jgi:uncharacterized protein YndB with AHSA1/START domain
MQVVSDREIEITRTFRAPARVVFDAWTRPELVQRWWAPASRGVSMASCDADVRAGGAYRYVMRTEDGQELAFSGTYSEVTPYRRLVYTSIFEPTRDAGAAIVTVTFEEHGGTTRLVAREAYPSKEVLEMVLATGMEDGMRETMDQLDELVTGLS